MAKTEPQTGDFTDELTALIKTLSLIEAPESWTRGTYARAADGQSIDRYSPDAVCFCLQGAYNRAVRETVNPAGGPFSAREMVLNQRIKDALRMQAGMVDLTLYNDAPGTTHQDVIKCLNRTIDDYRERHKAPRKKR